MINSSNDSSSHMGNETELARDVNVMRSECKFVLHYSLFVYLLLYLCVFRQRVNKHISTKNKQPRGAQAWSLVLWWNHWRTYSVWSEEPDVNLCRNVATRTCDWTVCVTWPNRASVFAGKIQSMKIQNVICEPKNCCHNQKSVITACASRGSRYPENSSRWSPTWVQIYQ